MHRQREKERGERERGERERGKNGRGGRERMAFFTITVFNLINRRFVHGWIKLRSDSVMACNAEMQESTLILSWSRFCIRFLKFKKLWHYNCHSIAGDVAIIIIVSEIRVVHCIAFITFNCGIIYVLYIFKITLVWYKHLLAERRAM